MVESGGVLRDEMMEKQIYGEAKGANNDPFPGLEIMEEIKQAAYALMAVDAEDCRL